MTNQQLVEYVREQLTHKMDINTIRTLLIQQGWTPQEVETAIYEAYGAAKAANKHHHTPFIGVAISSVVVIILFVALFLVVFKQTEPVIGPSITEPPPVLEPKLTGWAVCQAETDSVLKDACYQELNEREPGIDCESVTDEVERTFCFRAEEAVLLDRYARDA